MQKISISNRQECAHPSDIRFSWRRGNPAPRATFRWCNAAVGSDAICFNIGGEKTIYSYNINSGLWYRLPDCPSSYCSFAVIDNLPTAIGGIVSTQYSNKLYSLKHHTQLWIEEFPPMTTKRSDSTTICTKTALIVIGGDSGGSNGLVCVEVMNRETRQWSIATDIPSSMKRASVVICGAFLYVGGGKSKSVYSCSLSDLLQSCQSVSLKAPQRSSKTSSVWNKLSNLPEAIAQGSTLLSCCDKLLAIGGRAGGYSTKAVYIYKTTTSTNSWELISQMLVPRSYCFAVTLPTNKVMIVGGIGDGSKMTDAIDFADVI